MKFAVSVPDEIFAEAEALSRRLSISRSAVIARAVRELAEREQPLSLTEQINAVVDQMTDEDWEEQRMWMRVGARTAVENTEW